MPRTWLLVATSLLLLGGCVPTSALKMHDLYVYGVENARYTYFYGQTGELLYGDRSLTLAEPDAAQAGGGRPFAVAGALMVDGGPYLRQSLERLEGAPIAVSRLLFTTDVRLELGADVSEVVYFDGQSYLRLLDEGQAGTVQRVVPRPRLNRLRGLGELSGAEADALAAALEARGRPFALAVLPTASLPTHPVDGLSEHSRTGVFVQLGVEVSEEVAGGAAEELTWEVVARGSQAVGFQGASYQLVTSRDELIALWQRAYGSQLTVPPLPELDYRRETVVALFLGSKPTGGYGVDVVDARDEGGELYLDLRLTEPGPGTITTQALTSPWLVLRVLRAGYQAAWLRDAASGNLVGVARREQ